MKFHNGKIEADVCELCELALRSGDIDSRRAPNDRRNDAEADAWRHRRIKEGSLKEIYINSYARFGELEFELSGNVCLSEENGNLTVTELRVAQSYLSYKTPTREMLTHLRCLAYLYCEQNELSGIDMRLTLRFGDKEKNVDFYESTDNLRLVMQSVLSFAPAKR